MGAVRGSTPKVGLILGPPHYAFEMSGNRERIPLKTKAAKWGFPILLAGVVMLALGGSALYLAITRWNEQVTDEWYAYSLFVRVQNPGTTSEVWAPVPDFPELRNRTVVDRISGPSPIPM